MVGLRFAVKAPEHIGQRAGMLFFHELFNVFVLLCFRQPIPAMKCMPIS